MLQKLAIVFYTIEKWLFFILLNTFTTEKKETRGHNYIGKMWKNKSLIQSVILIRLNVLIPYTKYKKPALY